MQKTLLLTLLSVCFTSGVEAKSWFGTIDKYIIVNSGAVIEIGSTDISDDGQMAEYYDYRDGKRRTIQMADVSKSTRGEIAGVKAGETVLVTTMNYAKTATISRYCEVFTLFENKQAYVGCKTTEADSIPGYNTPMRLDYILSNVEQVTAEVEELNGVKKGKIMELRIQTKNAKAGRKVKVMAVFANGDVLVQKVGLNTLDTSSILFKVFIDRVTTADLNQLD